MQPIAFLKHLKLYLLRQTSPPPLFFFIFLSLRHLLPQNDYHQPFLHYIALFLAFTKNYNMLYLLPTFLSVSNPVVSLLFLVTTLLACDRKWKLYLCMFVIVDAWTMDRSEGWMFVGLGSLALCLVAYHNLFFQTNAEGQQYFIVFSILLTISVLQLIVPWLQIEPSGFSVVVVLIMAGFLSKNIYQIRLNAIKKLQLQKIKDPTLTARYIDILLQEFHNPAFRSAKLELHQKACCIVTCYCKKVQYAQDSEFYMQQMFEDLMRRLGCLHDQHLWAYYIEFYLKRDQALTAYYFLLKWRPTSYFALLSKFKCEAMIGEFLQKKDVFNPFIKEYVYGLEYDSNRLILSVEIHQILKLKIQFWKEVGRQSLSLDKLQHLGLQIVQKMHQLNNFYSGTIKQQEKHLYCFDSTVLYGMYLISTTNFKDYARTIIKSTSKQMQQACVSERNASQTFVIRAVIKKSKESTIRHNSKQFATQIDQKRLSTLSLLKVQQRKQNEFKLVIDSVSSGFCRMVNLNKQEMQGKDLHALIPNCYTQVHNARLGQILNFDSDQIKYVSPAKVLHTELILLLKGRKDQLFSGWICIKYHMDVEEGVAFLSIFRKTAQKKSMALATFEGELMEKERDFPPEIMQHSLVQKYLAKMKQEWARSRTVAEQKFGLIIDQTNYLICIDSPYAFLLSDKQALQNMPPPLHVQLMNQDPSMRRAAANFKPNNRADQQIRKMDNMMMLLEQESSNSNSKGANYLVTIISNFSETNSAPLYKYIILTFLLLLVANIALNATFTLFSVLPWDNTSPTQNSIIDNINMLSMSIFHGRMALNLQDLSYYKQYSQLLNTTRISKFYAMPYTTYISQSFLELNIDLAMSTFSLFSTSSPMLLPAIYSRFNSNLILPNLIDGQPLSTLPTQNLTYKEVVFLFSVDIYLITQKMKEDSLLITSLYQEVDKQTANMTQIPKIIQKAFDSAYKKQVAIGLGFIAIIILLIIPMIFVLRNRFTAHEKVFDLLSSIDSAQVAREIESLLYIDNILSNYNESERTLKLNMLDYPAKKINLTASKQKGRKPSVLNELVTGLQRFDVASNSTEGNINSSQDIVQYVKPNSQNSYNLQSLFTAIRRDQIAHLAIHSQFKPRIRSGELDLSGSQFDPSSKIIPKHCFIYIMLVSFVAFLGYALAANLEHYSTAKLAHEIMQKSYNQLYVFNSKLYEAKSFLWDGGDRQNLAYNMTEQVYDLMDFLTQPLEEDVFNSEDGATIQSGNFTKTKTSQRFQMLKLLQNQIISILKSLVEYRYNYEIQNSKAPSQLPPNYYENILYLQLLNNQREASMRAIAEDILSGMYQSERVAAQDRKILMTVMLVWGVLCFVIGLGLTLQMKQQFFKEVYILTFLNEQMLLTNKRVESYLSNLNKNSYF